MPTQQPIEKWDGDLNTHCLTFDNITLLTFGKASSDKLTGENST